MRFLLALSLALLPSVVAAHGIYGHMHVTGWAIENLPDGELKDFFSDPEVFNAAIFGAAFTDSGYWEKDPAKEDAARAYGEHTHWEPFIEDFVSWVMLNDPPPWVDQESRLRVAFMMGCASHGMQDEIFDSLFLHQVEHKDTGSQDNADPGTDGFLALDGHIRFMPDPYIPMDTLLELYAVLPEGITEGIITHAVGLMTTVYVNDTIGPQVAASLGEAYEAELPWTRLHFLDPEVPGSLRAEIFPTMRYMEALWKRLHGTLGAEDVVIWTFPDPPRRLYGVDATSPDPWVTFIYGVGVGKGSVQTVWTADAGEAAVPYQQVGTRWGADWTRLHRLQPTASLEPAAWYTVLWGGGERIDGGELSEVEFHFQAPCSVEGDVACPDLGPLPVATIDPPDAGGWADAGGQDGGVPDGGADDAGGAGGGDAGGGDDGGAPGGDIGGGGGDGGGSGGDGDGGGSGGDGVGGGPAGGDAGGGPGGGDAGSDGAGGGSSAEDLGRVPEGASGGGCASAPTTALPAAAPLVAVALLIAWSRRRRER